MGTNYMKHLARLVSARPGYLDTSTLFLCCSYSLGLFRFFVAYYMLT
jgi:hypothetical protein